MRVRKPLSSRGAARSHRSRSVVTVLLWLPAGPMPGDSWLKGHSCSLTPQLSHASCALGGRPKGGASCGLHHPTDTSALPDSCPWCASLRLTSTFLCPWQVEALNHISSASPGWQWKAESWPPLLLLALPWPTVSGCCGRHACRTMRRFCRRGGL